MLSLIQFFDYYPQDMQTAKPSQHFKIDGYDVEVDVLAERKVSIAAVELTSRVQFVVRDAKLEVIGANTLIKALQRSNPDITAAFATKLIGDENFLEIKVKVNSAFLKPVQEVVLLKKNREISENDAIKKAVGNLSQRINEIKEAHQKNNVVTLYGGKLEQRNYSSNNYEELASIKLPKGKFLLTFSFLVKANSQWMYIYFKNGESLMQNSGFYLPNTTSFIPYTVRKIYTVSNESEVVHFSTNSTSSYPIVMRNAITTAKPIGE